MDPKVLEQVSILKLLGEYKDLMLSDNWYAYNAEMQQRNSSAQWEDDSEFSRTPLQDANLTVSPFFQGDI